MEWDCGLEDSSTPAMELEHHAQVCPGLPVYRMMLEAPFPFFNSTDQPLGIRGHERGKEKSFTKGDID